MRVPRLSVLLLAVLMARGHLQALDPGKAISQYAHRVWSQEEGLPDPSILAILQSKDGFLWAGSQTGLYRFDGTRFENMLDPPGFSEHILIRSLSQGRDGVIWAAAPGRGLARIDGGKVTWLTSPEVLPSNDVFCAVPSGNTVWVCTSDGLVKLDGQTKKVYTTDEGLPGNRVRDVVEASDRSIWVASLDFGLARLENGRFHRVENGPPADHPVFALERVGDSIWASTDIGIFVITPTGSRRFSVRDGLPSNRVTSLVASPDGTIWAGTDEGVARFRSGEWTSYRSGLPNRSVLSLAVDREGSLWVGTKNGLHQFTDSPVTPYTTAEGLPASDAGPIAETPDGIIWLGTSHSGLVRFDSREFHAVTTHDGLASNRVVSLAADANGNLWAGTSRGLTLLKAGRVIRTWTVQDGLPGNVIRALYIDAQSSLWVGTNRGLAVMRDGRVEIPRQHFGLEKAEIVALGGGKAIRLFISTATGDLFILRGETFSAPADFETVRPVTAYDADPVHHTLWMGTAGSGLLRFHAGVLTRVRARNGLLDGSIYAILPDAHDHFWFASSKGIFRVNRVELDEFAEGKRSFINSVPFSTGHSTFECQAGVSPAAYRTRDGRLWFSTTNGLVVVDPDHPHLRSLAPPVVVEDMTVNGEPRDSSSPATLLPDEQNVSFRYAGLSFISPEKMSFRYKLEGYDKRWIEAGNRREAFYTNLPPGKFRFRVMSSTSDGVWSPTAASFSFTIDRPWYEQSWFYALSGLCLMALAVLAYRMRIRKLRAQFELVLAERSRIARELHDTLLQGFSGITMQLQALSTKIPFPAEKHTLNEIIEESAACLSEARQSLWALRSTRKSGRGLVADLSLYARQAAGQDTALRLVLDERIAIASPETEYQLMRIAQEAIANAMRHARPDRLEVKLLKVGDLVTLSVSDSGPGFNVDNVQVGHFGLKAMQERADELGAQLTIRSDRETGTTVSLRLPFKPSTSHAVKEANANLQI